MSLLSTARAIASLVRPRHWIKNAFVIAPLLFAGAWYSPTAIAATAAAFAAFCLLASAVYIINDLADIERDRAHPIKRLRRPLASGALQPRTAIAVTVALLMLAMLASSTAPATRGVLALYLGINIAYSLRLKHVPVADLFAVASGFVLRVEAGALAIGVPCSDWMLITTGCLALYLAAVKRRAELVSHGEQGREVLTHYTVRLVDRYAEHAATAALLFYGLFVVTNRPALAPTIPLVMFGMYRYWYVAERGNSGESPTDAFLTDAPLLLTVAAWAGACAWYLQHNPLSAP